MSFASKSWMGATAARVQIRIPGVYGVPEHFHIPDAGQTFTALDLREGAPWASAAEIYDRYVRLWQRWAAEELADSWEHANVHK